MNEKIKIISSVVCDDIRREQNGKDILIGVYGSGIKVQTIPATLILSLWIEMKVFVAGQYTLKVRVSGQNNSVLFETPNVPLIIPKIQSGAEALNAPIIGIPLTLQSANPIEFQLSIDGEWQTIRTMDVIVGTIELMALKPPA